VKRRALIGLGALLVLALRVAGDQQVDNTASQTTTAKPVRQNRDTNRHKDTGKSDGTKNPGQKRGTDQTKTNTNAPETDTITTAAGSAAQTPSVSGSDGSTATGTTTDAWQAGAGTNTAATSGGTASTVSTDTSVTDTTVTNPAGLPSGTNRLLPAVLILAALTLAAVTASFIAVWGRFAGLESRLRKLDFNLESSLGPLTRDLSPLVGTPVRVIKTHELAEGISKELTVLRNDVAELKKRAKGIGGGGERENTSSRPPQTLESYEPEPPVERDDDSIHDFLLQVASDCVQSPITQSQARARVGRGWDITSFGTGELPDGFVVDAGRGDAWFVPNTRRWSALRGEGLFDVAGPDLPTARIIRIDSLPRVRRRGGPMQLASGKRGRLEISIA